MGTLLVGSAIISRCAAMTWTRERCGTEPLGPGLAGLVTGSLGGGIAVGIAVATL
jgi:hypothetical protein